jgi:TonB family protein
MLCVGAALAAQEATPEAKSETTPQQSASQQPRQPVRVPLRIRVSRAVSEALIVKKVQPDYPQEAREALVQGEVVLRIAINREGDVSKADLLSGDQLLAGAAIDAVKQWKYKPYLLDGNPLEVDTEAVVDFRLPKIIKLVPSDATAPAPAAVTGVVGDSPGGYGSQVRQGGVIGGIISSERVRVSQGVSNGLVVKKVPPHYPEEARKGRIQGTVVMHAIISKAGDIATLELISGHPALAPAAIEAVKQWKYKPYLLNGKPVEVDTQIQVNFTLSEN